MEFASSISPRAEVFAGTAVGDLGLRLHTSRQREPRMRLLIDNASVWDGTGAAAFPGKVLVEDNRIAAVAPQAESLAAADGAEKIDAGGKFLMPGMVEGHAHLSFVDTPRG